MKKSFFSVFVCWLLMTAHAVSAPMAVSFSGGVAPSSERVLGTPSAALNSIPTIDTFVVTVLVTPILCASDTFGGALNTIIIGGQSPFSFLWSDGNTDASRQNMPAGTYGVTVTDANGATSEDQAVIVAPLPLTTTLVAIVPACGSTPNGSATVVASGGTPPYTHVWMPGGYSGDAVTGLAAGPYSIHTVDANQCPVDAIFYVPEISQLDVVLSVLSAECTGVDDGVVTAIVSPPGNYDFFWNLPPGTGVTQLTGLPANTYVSVTVTDPLSGCSGAATTTVSGHNAITVHVVDTDVTCAGVNNGTALASASGGTPDYQYVWMFPPSGPVIGNSADVGGLDPGAYIVSVTDSRGCKGFGAADIGVESGPEAVIEGLTSVLCGETETVVQFDNLSTDVYGTIVSTVWTITTSGFSQTISDVNSIQLTLPVGVAGTVHLQVTSANGCVSDATTNFIVPGLPNISLSIGAVALNCDNAPVPLIVQGGSPSYTYAWSPLAGLTLDSTPPNAVANPSETTTFQLIASDQGCEDTVSVVVIRVTPIELSVADDIVVTCDSVVVLSATANQPNVVWTDASGQLVGEQPANPVTVPAGATVVYTAMVSDLYGCTATASVSVTGEGTNVMVDPDLPTVGCTGEDIQLGIINNHPGDVLQYFWTVTPPLVINGANSAFPSVSGPAGNYAVTVTVTNQYGCAQTFVVPIQIDAMVSLTEAITADLCSGKTVQFFNTSGVEGLWSFGDTDTSSLVNPVHIYAASGTYNVSFVPNNNVCIMPWDSTISVQEVILEVSLQQDTMVCNGAPLLVSASGNGLLYEWSAFPSFNPLLFTGPILTVTPVKNGVYYVRTTNLVGCEAVDSIKINNVSVDLQLDPIDQTICEGDETELSVTNQDVEDVLSYEWSPSLPNIPNPVVSPSQETTYQVVVTNQFGCTDVLDFLVKVTNVSVSAEVTGKETICPGMSTTILATSSGNGTGVTYAWSPSFGLSDDTVADPLATPESDQSYVVTVTTQEGCTATDDVFIQVISGQCVEPYIFVPKAFTPNNDANNDFFIVRGVSITELQFIVWDRWGEKVYETNDPSAQGWDGTYKGKELTPDTYAWYLRARCGNGAVYESKGDVTLLK